MENSQEQNQRPNLPKKLIFQTVKKNLSALGISLDLSMQSRLLNARLLLSLLAPGLCNIGMLLYSFNEAQTVFQFTQSIFICSAYTLSILFLLIILCYSNELFKLINDCECIVNTSKWRKFSQKRLAILLPTRQKQMQFLKIFFSTRFQR